MPFALKSQGIDRHKLRNKNEQQEEKKITPDRTDRAVRTVEITGL